MDLQVWFSFIILFERGAGKKNPAVRTKVHLFKKTLSKQFMDCVVSGRKRDVNVGFTFDTVERSGEWEGEKYDYSQENLLIDHFAVGVLVGRMRAPFIGLGCNSVDFETEPVDTGLATNPVPETVNAAAKTEITLPKTHENTSILISKLTNNSLVNGIKI